MAKAGRKALAPEKRKKRTHKEKYQIKYYIEGIPIREMNVISIYISEPNMVQIARAIKDTPISVAKVLAYSCCPCEHCAGKHVVIKYKGKSLNIPRGLLSIGKMSSGSTIKKLKIA